MRTNSIPTGPITPEERTEWGTEAQYWAITSPHKLQMRIRRLLIALTQAEAERDVLAEYLDDIGVDCPSEKMGCPFPDDCPAPAEKPTRCWIAWARQEAQRRKE